MPPPLLLLVLLSPWQVADGVNTMIFGRIAGVAQPLAIVGGNCSIQGFDSEGNEPYWTVTGDNVAALALVDVTGDGNVSGPRGILRRGVIQ